MSADYDLLIDKDGDIVLKDGWDLETVEGAALVTQDIRRVLEFPIGALPYSPKTGSQLQHAINAPADPALLECELLRVSREDARIDQESIHITYTPSGAPVLHFRTLEDTETQEVHLS